MPATDNEPQVDRLKIALVITELEPGGAETCLTELAIFLSTRGHRVRVYSLGPAPLGQRAILVERLKSTGMEIQFGNARALFDVWHAKNWLRQCLLEFKPDIVQSMLWHANVVSAIALRSMQTVFVGGVRVAEPKRFRWWAQRWIAWRVSRFVCVSHDVARHCREEEGIGAKKLVVIPNGISIPASGNTHAQWSMLGLPDNLKVVLFVGRLEPQKGAVALLEHADDILAKAPDHHLILMGQGSEEHRLRTIARQRLHRNRIHLVGWQANAQAWMRAAHVVVLPAIYEGMPNVLIEAMAVAKPFVAFAVDGVGELIDSAECRELAAAQVTQLGDWGGFTVRVIRFALDESMRKLIGTANKEHVEKHFQLNVQLGKYESLYFELVSRSRVKRG